MSLKLRTLNASLLVIGTSIGAAILGLPVESSRGGFFPSFLSLFIVWLAMTLSALLLIEVLSGFKPNTNYITITEKLLGKSFKIITFIIYLILFLSLTVAYTKGGGVFLSDTINHLDIAISCFIFLLIFTSLILLGPKVLSFGNTPLSITLFCSFFTIIILGLAKIKPSLLSYVNWKEGCFSFPLFITSFGFHSVLPSLSSYVDNKKALRKAVITGTSITFFIYLLWQLFVLGIVPYQGEISLEAAFANDQTAITPLKLFISNSIFQVAASTFYFTAIATSFLGVGLGLIDFLLDAFKIKQNFLNRLFMCLLVYLPALWISQSSLNIFYISLKYGGGFACLYLFIALPILFMIRNKGLKFYKKY